MNNIYLSVHISSLPVFTQAYFLLYKLYLIPMWIVTHIFLAAKAALDFTLFVRSWVCLWVCLLVTLFWHPVKNDLHFVALSLWKFFFFDFFWFSRLKLKFSFFFFTCHMTINRYDVIIFYLQLYMKKPY